MADQRRERNFFEEFINLYKDQRCLWDFNSNCYKDALKKKKAWGILLEKYKELEPTAYEDTVRRKIENMRSSYKREAKKVAESNNIFKPNLWYFELMSFLDTKDAANKSGADSHMSEDEEELQAGAPKRKKISKERYLELKQIKLLDTAQELLKTENKTELNPFAAYIGKKLEDITPGLQRDLAEKLIVEVMFLAKTNNLTFDTKIDIPSTSRTHNYESHNFDPCFIQPTSTHNSQSPHSSSAYSHSVSAVSLQLPSPTEMNEIKQEDEEFQ